MKNLSKSLTLAFAAILGLGLNSCSDDDKPTNSGAGESQVMVIHASPDAPAVDILVDNVVALQDVPFPVNSGYVALESGTRNIKVNVANTSTTVINANLPLEDDTYYSVFAIDSVASIEALVLEDDLTAPATGKAHVRFIHLSPDAPAVDIGVVGGGVVFGNVEFKEVVDFTPLDAATYNLEVRLAGTSTVVLPLGNITLNAGDIYTVFAKGYVNDDAGNDDDDLGAEIIVNLE